MKKFTAILLALVMIFTFVAITACKGETKVRLILDAGGNNPTRQHMHVVGKDDIPGVTNDNLAFGGWYYDKALTKPFVVEDDQTEDGMVLYAKWRVAGLIPEKVVVTLTPNYEGAAVTVYQLDKGEKITLPNLSREGYTLSGWFTEPAGGIQWADDTALSVNTNLYAHWTAKTQDTPAPTEKVTLTLIPNYEGSSATVYNLDKGSTFTLTTPSDREGYTFDGWYATASGGTKCASEVKVTENSVLYAHWTATGQDDTPTPTVDKVVLTLCPNYEGAQVVNHKLDAGAEFTFTSLSRSGYTFDGWYTAATGGAKLGASMNVNADAIVYAHWTAESQDDDPAPHTHNFGDNYFMYVKCSVEGCDVIGRNEGSSAFKDAFTYSYTQSDKDEMVAAYNTLKNQINAGTVSVNTIISGVNAFEEYYDDIQSQYQVATVLYSVNYNDEWEEKSTLVGEAYNEWFQYYFTLCGLINDSSYSSSFFADWKDDDKAYVLEMAAIYSASEENLQTIADNLANEYNNVLYNISSEDELSNLYEPYSKYVQANNNIAAQYGSKYANYMDYAYANEYGREYTPAQVATMRNYVKTVIAPIFLTLRAELNNLDAFFDDNYNFYDGMEDDYYFYEALALDSLFTLEEGYEQGTYDATNYIGNYFKYLNNNQTGSTEINFYKEVNKLFQNGNYFTSSDGEEGAYTYYIVDKKTPIMYFDDSYDSSYGYSYSTAFTFVHEFGHYYADIYTNGGDFSMDHAETHSQGDEMMFLAWLSQNCPDGAEYGYKVLQMEQLVNILRTIVQSTVIDEFEQAVYSNTYGDGEFKDGIPYEKYGDLYQAILDSYGEGMSGYLGTYYWAFVVVDSSAYYISYAMSALPSVELYVEAMAGLDNAREKYFKLFTFVDSSNADTDGDGEVTYSEVLAYAGLDSPFAEAMYSNISNYFDNFTV